MIFNVCAVKDELTGKFMQPFYVKEEKEALRLFQHNVN